MQDKSLN